MIRDRRWEFDRGFRFIHGQRQPAGQGRRDGESELTPGHIAFEFDEEFNSEHRLSIAPQPDAHSIAPAQEPDIGRRCRELLDRNLVTKQREGLPGFGRRDLDHRFEARHALVDRAVVSRGRDGNALD